MVLSVISISTFGQQIVNGNFENWEGNDNMLNPSGWITSNIFDDDNSYISVVQTANACNGNYSVKISSTGPSLEGPGIGYISQEVIFENPVSSASIDYSFAVDTLSEDTYGAIKITAIQISEEDSTIVGNEEMIFDEINPVCSTGSLTITPDVQFHKISIHLSANPRITGLGTEGIAIIHFDDIALATVSTNTKSRDFIKFTLHPNPVLNQFTLRTETIIKGLTLTNITGKLVKKLDSDQREIDMSYLPSGIYFLRIDTANGFHNEKVVKQ